MSHLATTAGAPLWQVFLWILPFRCCFPTFTFLKHKQVFILNNLMDLLNWTFLGRPPASRSTLICNSLTDQGCIPPMLNSPPLQKTCQLLCSSSNFHISFEYAGQPAIYTDSVLLFFIMHCNLVLDCDINNIVSILNNHTLFINNSILYFIK